MNLEFLDHIGSFLGGLGGIIAALVAATQGKKLVKGLNNFVQSRETRIYENLNKWKIFMVSTNNYSFEEEKNLMKENNHLFNEPQVISKDGIETCNREKKSSIFIVYSSPLNKEEGELSNEQREQLEQFMIIFNLVREKAKATNSPIIFYFKGDFPSSKLNELKKYPYHEICNSAYRLMSLIHSFAMLTPITKPEGKNLLQTST